MKEKEEEECTNRVKVYLHLSKMEGVSQIMGVNRADADVAICCHHSFHRHPGNSRVGRRPAEISTPPRCLRQVPENTSARLL